MISNLSSRYNLSLRNIYNTLLSFLTLFIIYHSPQVIIAQDITQESLTTEQTFELIKVKYGYDQILVNGSYYEYLTGRDLGHPFMLSEDYHRGHIVIHNKRYDNLLLKYNIFEQRVVVLYVDNIGTQLAFLPPLNFISEFSLDNLIFKKYKFDNKIDNIYQEVYSGEIKCLYAWKKGREDSHHNIQYSAYKYYRPARKSFLVIDNSIYQYKGKATFLRLFPQEHKKEISNFMKDQKLNLKNSKDIEIVKLMTFCEGLITNN